MKILHAKKLMQQNAGYRVHFEKREGGMLASDFFPDRDEPPIIDLEDAWKLAEGWSKVDANIYVNVYVTNALDSCPVENYQLRRLNTYPYAALQAPEDMK